jgi:SNF family Na+-dependent transporter
MMSSGRDAFTTCSSTGSRSFIELIFFSWIRIAGFSSTISMRSGSVTKYADR